MCVDPLLGHGRVSAEKWGFLVSNVCRPPTGSWSSFCREVDFSRTSVMCVDPLLGHGRVSAEKWIFLELQ